MPYENLSFLQQYNRIASKLDRAILWRLNWEADLVPETVWMNFQAVYGGLFEAASAIVSDHDFSKFVRLRLNPQQLSTDHPKFVSHQKTSGDTFEITQGGNDLRILNFTGTSGYMLPPLWRQGLMDTTFSEASLNFAWFVSMYEESHKDRGIVRMVFDGKKYDGYLANLRTDRTVESPFEIKYSFSFYAIPQATIDLTTLIIPAEIIGALQVAEAAASVIGSFSSLWESPITSVI